MVLDASDIRAFADVATDFEDIEQSGGGRQFRFFMNSEMTVLNVSPDGKVCLTTGEREFKAAHVRSLLASENFSDLKGWAANQSKILQEFTTDGAFTPISIVGELITEDGQKANVDLEKFDRFLATPNAAELQVIVIDGPAGIGKTTQIKGIAANRALNFARDQQRLVLHVESRGGSMQMLDDLIASSLQRIRAKPTFDQLRVLVKHGLVTLAVDGFDEFADPAGFQLAWAQLGNLLDEVFGNGQVILSGRETLVSRDRMKKELHQLERPGVVVDQLMIREVDAQSAKDWLLARGLPAKAFDHPRLEEALRPGSYGLRPFFLAELAKRETYAALYKSPRLDILSILVDALIEREKSKFDDVLVKFLGEEQLAQFVRDVCQEIARDMADNQVEALPGTNIEWLADVCVPRDATGDIRNLLIHHAARLPFLTADTSSSIVRFSHRQFMVYFLGSNAIEIVGQGESSKYLKRNVLGSEFMEAFPKVLAGTSALEVRKFQKAALDMLPSLSNFDRGRGNVAALLLASGCEVTWPGEINLSHLSIDELYLKGKAARANLSGVGITTLRAERADLRSLEFDDGCQIVALHCDKLTRFSTSIPLPTWLEDDAVSFHNPSDIKKHIGKRNQVQNFDEVSLGFSSDLIERILRYRPFWLRLDVDNADPNGRAILQHPNWEDLLDHLREHELIRFDGSVPAGGPLAPFIHFRIEDIKVHFGF